MESRKDFFEEEEIGSNFFLSNQKYFTAYEMILVY